MDNLERIKKHVNQSDVVWFFSDIYGVVLGIGNFMGYDSNSNIIHITRGFNSEYYERLSRSEKNKFKKFLEFEYKIIVNKVIV